MKKRRILAGGLALVWVVVILGGPVFAQIIPVHEQHYKTYLVESPIGYDNWVTLIDQFVDQDALAYDLERFSNPAEKIIGPMVEPILDPRVHLTWWRIDPQGPPVEGYVDLFDQFGSHRWTFRDAEYLLNPALKDEPGTPPIWNHYKCYRVVGAMPIDRQVTLFDQFDQVTVMLLEPMWFCNPVEKIDATGNAYPIIHPEAHLACYHFAPIPYSRQVFLTDQFIQEPVVAVDSDCLCVPAVKEGAVSTTASSWSRLKALFD